MKRRQLTAAVLTIGSLLGVAPGRAGTVVTGAEQSTLLLPDGIRVAPYANDGYRLSVDGESVLVEVSVAALRSSAPLPRPTSLAAAGSDAARVARGVAAGAETQYDAASRVLSWVARQIRYDLDRTQSQEPDAVLARRSAYCTGVARLTVAMLRGLGIEAREVAGYVLADRGAGGEFHRWVEIRYPDRGWVFSDPLRSHHFVPATYLRLTDERAVREASANALVLTRRTSLREVDVTTGTPPSVRIRSNFTRSTHGALRVAVDPASTPAMLVLEGGGRRWAREVDATGLVDFPGLEPGDYDLEWRAGNRTIGSQRVRLTAPVWAEVRLVAGAVPATLETGER